jgi:hypothetical protein
MVELLAPKFDILLKHEGRRLTIKNWIQKNAKKGDIFLAKECISNLALDRK